MNRIEIKLILTKNPVLAKGIRIFACEVSFSNISDLVDGSNTIRYCISRNFLYFVKMLILKHKHFRCTFSFLSKGIILWIELPWPENPASTCAWHTETLDSCFDVIRSHQQWIPWHPSLEIEQATTERRAETLPLSLLSTQVTPNLLVIIFARPINLKVTYVHFTEDTVTSRTPSSQED